MMRRVFLIAALVWIGVNVLLSVAGLLFALGDSPVIGTTNVTLTQVVWDSGTVVSPPLVFMVVAALLLGGGATRNHWVSRIATVLLVVGIGVIAWDTQGGLHSTAPQYSSAKWGLVLALGWFFFAVSALTVLAGIVWLATQVQHRPAGA